LELEEPDELMLFEDPALGEGDGAGEAPLADDEEPDEVGAAGVEVRVTPTLAQSVRESASAEAASAASQACSIH